MAEGSVRVDAEFATSHTFPRERNAPRAVGVTAMAIAVAAFALGWVFGVATPPEEVAAPSPASTTTMTWDVTPTTVVSASLPIAAPARLPSALGAAVPGFADSVTFVVENDRTVDIVRWLPTHPELEILLSIDRAMLAGAAADTDLPPVALDSSGRWYALIDSAGALAVGTIPTVDDSTDVVQAATIAGGSGELITTPMWNVAQPGQLVWLESSTAGDESVVALRTVDLGGDAAPQIATISGSTSGPGSRHGSPPASSSAGRRDVLRRPDPHGELLCSGLVAGRPTGRPRRPDDRVRIADLRRRAREPEPRNGSQRGPLRRPGMRTRDPLVERRPLRHRPDLAPALGGVHACHPRHGARLRGVDPRRRSARRHEGRRPSLRRPFAPVCLNRRSPR